MGQKHEVDRARWMGDVRGIGGVWGADGDHGAAGTGEFGVLSEAQGFVKDDGSVDVGDWEVDEYHWV